MDRVEVDDVVLSRTEHEDRDLVLDLLVAALRPASALQELRCEVGARVLVNGAAHGGEFAPGSEKGESCISEWVDVDGADGDVDGAEPHSPHSAYQQAMIFYIQ